MAECLNCGRWVSDDFARVMGNRDEEVKVCIHCGSIKELGDAVAKGEEASDAVAILRKR